MPEAAVFTGEFAALAEVVGASAAQRLLGVFGGRRLYVPRTAGDAHPITVAIGREQADRLCDFWHGTILYFPIGASKRQQILDLARAGRAPTAIAAELMCSDRHVYAVLAEARQEAQPSLF